MTQRICQSNNVPAVQTIYKIVSVKKLRAMFLLVGRFGSKYSYKADSTSILLSHISHEIQVWRKNSLFSNHVLWTVNFLSCLSVHCGLHHTRTELWHQNTTNAMLIRQPTRCSSRGTDISLIINKYYIQQHFCCVLIHTNLVMILLNVTVHYQNNKTRNTKQLSKSENTNNQK